MRFATTRRLLLAALILGSGWACTEMLVSVVGVSRLDIEPPAVTVFVDDTIRLEALLEDASGNELSGREIDWSSQPAGIVEIDGAGLLRALAVGVTTVTATSEGVDGSASVTVLTPPRIEVDEDTLALSALIGLADSAVAQVAITNGGDGEVAGLGASVEYEAGATGWLEATLSQSRAPATLTLTARGAALDAGSYRATVRLAGSTRNSPLTLAVSFELLQPWPVPAIAGVAPDHAQREETLEVEITGDGFVDGVTLVDLGERITVNSVTVESATTLRAGITLDRSAALGARPVTVINPPPGGGSATLDGAFTVEGENPFPTIQGVQPDNGQRQATLDVTVQGTGFLEEITTVDFGPDIAVNAVTVTGATTLVASITIGASAVAGPRDVHVANPAPGGGIATRPDAFLVLGDNPAPSLSAVQPASARRLESLDVAVTGAEFAAGLTTVDFGPDITVNAMSVDSATGLTASITVGPMAALGARAVSVTNAGPGGGTATLNGAFTVLPGAVSATVSAVTASDSVAADGATPATVTVLLRDAAGNALPGMQSADFAVATTGSAASTAVLETATPGTYAFTVTDGVVESVTVTVTATGVTLAQQPVIEFTAGGVSSVNSGVSANPTTGLVANGVAASTVTCTLRDAQNNPIAGFASQFNIFISGSGKAGAVTETATPGTYTFLVTDTVAQTVSVTVRAGDTRLAQQPTIEFVPGPVSGAVSEVSASPSLGVLANGVAFSTVTVIVRDAFGNPIGGLAASDFSVLVSGSAVAGAVGASATPGTYTFTVTNTTAQTVTVAVTAAGVALAQQPAIQFVPADVSATMSGVSASPSAGVVANGVAASTVTVLLRDGNGNAIPNVPLDQFVVVLTGEAVAGAGSEPIPGTYRFNVTNTKAETVAVTVTVGVTTLAQQPAIQFVPGPISPANSSVTASPATGVPVDEE